MTKAQKKLFKALKNNDHRAAFVDMLITQQQQIGKFDHWAVAYAKKARKKKAKLPASLQDRVKAG